jgi:hypothetical protein
MTKRKQLLTQQEFLRHAMETLGMTRDEFAERIGAARRRLDTWLLPSESNGFRELDSMAWKFVREMKGQA